MNYLIRWWWYVIETKTGIYIHFYTNGIISIYKVTACGLMFVLCLDAKGFNTFLSAFIAVFVKKKKRMIEIMQLESSAHLIRGIRFGKWTKLVSVVALYGFFVKSVVNFLWNKSTFIMQIICRDEICISYYCHINRLITKMYWRDFLITTDKSSFRKCNSNSTSCQLPETNFKLVLLLYFQFQER